MAKKPITKRKSDTRTFRDKLKGWEGSASTLKQELVWEGDVEGLPLVDTAHKNHRISGGSKTGLYYDSEGKLTAGYGHLVTGDDSLSDLHGLNQPAAEALLDKDIQKHDALAKKYFRGKGVDIDEQPESLVDLVRSMVFNVGLGKDPKFNSAGRRTKKGTGIRDFWNMGEALKQDDYEGVVREAKNSKRWKQIKGRGPEEVSDIQDLIEQEDKVSKGLSKVKMPNKRRGED